MAAYNGENYIKEQINSILKQTIKDWHLYICDDCSSDNTVDIVLDYVNKYPDKITLVQNSENMGHKATFFKLLKMSKGDYVFTCDQDDVWNFEKIERELQAMLENEATLGVNFPLMVHSDLELIDGEGASMHRRMSQTIGADPKAVTPAQLLMTGVATGCTIGLNRACLTKALECKCHDSVLMHDWWVALVAAILGRRIYIDSPLVFYRQHGDNVVGAAIAPFEDIARDYVATGRQSGINGIIERVVAGEVDRIKQAILFLEAYDANLSCSQKREIRAIADIPDEGLLRRFAVVNERRLWRRGLKRKVRQCFALAFISGFASRDASLKHE